MTSTNSCIVVARSRRSIHIVLGFLQALYPIRYQSVSDLLLWLIHQGAPWPVRVSLPELYFIGLILLDDGGDAESAPESSFPLLSLVGRCLGAVAGFSLLVEFLLSGSFLVLAF